MNKLATIIVIVCSLATVANAKPYGNGGPSATTMGQATELIRTGQDVHTALKLTMVTVGDMTDTLGHITGTVMAHSKALSRADHMISGHQWTLEQNKVVYTKTTEILGRHQTIIDALLERIVALEAVVATLKAEKATQ